jgi:hypothetical protein
MAETPVGEVILKNVRLSFPALFEPDERQNDDGETRRVYKAAFLIPKEGDEFGNMAKLRAAADQAKAKKWGPDKANWPKLKSERLCVRDGDEESWAGYAGHFYVSASAPEGRQPSIITNRKDKDKRWIEARPGQQGAPYAGCYVNAVVRLWAQDDKRYGKRINASLESVQFRADGEAFGAAPVDPNSKFTDDDVSDVADYGDDDEDMI